jgi:hypothetical protein
MAHTLRVTLTGTVDGRFIATNSVSRIVPVFRVLLTTFPPNSFIMVLLFGTTNFVSNLDLDLHVIA